MEKLLISACLIGSDCKYNGGNNALSDEELKKLREKYILVPVCPESAGGLPTPRVPGERRGAQVVAKDGRDLTENFRRGAEIALLLAQRHGCRKALLKAKSPSCGSGSIYDGSFSGTLISGDGVTAQLLKEKGIQVFSENESDELI